MLILILFLLKSRLRVALVDLSHTSLIATWHCELALLGAIATVSYAHSAEGDITAERPTMALSHPDWLRKFFGISFNLCNALLR